MSELIEMCLISLEHLTHPLARQLLILQLALNGALVGLISIIHWVHYPTFPFIDPLKWSSFHARHVRAITPIAGPLMVAELCVSGATLYLTQAAPLTLITGLCTALGFASTFFGAVPAHDALSERFEGGAFKRLMRADRLRTVAWLLSCSLLISATPLLVR